jgi:hypothetical protein
LVICKAKRTLLQQSIDGKFLSIEARKVIKAEFSIKQKNEKNRYESTKKSEKPNKFAYKNCNNCKTDNSLIKFT